MEDLRGTSEYFKTQICSFWSAGHCRAGFRCRHAHGADELRLLDSNIDPLPMTLPSPLNVNPVNVEPSDPQYLNSNIRPSPDNTSSASDTVNQLISPHHTTSVIYSQASIPVITFPSDPPSTPQQQACRLVWFQLPGGQPSTTTNGCRPPLDTQTVYLQGTYGQQYTQWPQCPISPTIPCRPIPPRKLNLPHSVAPPLHHSSQFNARNFCEPIEQQNHFVCSSPIERNLNGFLISPNQPYCLHSSFSLNSIT